MPRAARLSGGQLPLGACRRPPGVLPRRPRLRTPAWQATNSRQQATRARAAGDGSNGARIRRVHPSHGVMQSASRHSSCSLSEHEAKGVFGPRARSRRPRRALSPSFGASPREGAIPAGIRPGGDMEHTRAPATALRLSAKHRSPDPWACHHPAKRNRPSREYDLRKSHALGASFPDCSMKWTSRTSVKTRARNRARAFRACRGIAFAQRGKTETRRPLPRYVPSCSKQIRSRANLVLPFPRALLDEKSRFGQQFPR